MPYTEANFRTDIATIEAAIDSAKAHFDTALHNVGAPAHVEHAATTLDQMRRLAAQLHENFAVGHGRTFTFDS